MKFRVIKNLFMLNCHKPGAFNKLADKTLEKCHFGGRNCDLVVDLRPK